MVERVDKRSRRASVFFEGESVACYRQVKPHLLLHFIIRAGVSL